MKNVVITKKRASKDKRNSYNVYYMHNGERHYVARNVLFPEADACLRSTRNAGVWTWFECIGVRTQ